MEGEEAAPYGLDLQGRPQQPFLQPVPSGGGGALQPFPRSPPFPASGSYVQVPHPPPVPMGNTQGTLLPPALATTPGTPPAGFGAGAGGHGGGGNGPPFQPFAPFGLPPGYTAGPGLLASMMAMQQQQQQQQVGGRAVGPGLLPPQQRQQQQQPDPALLQQQLQLQLQLRQQQLQLLQQQAAAAAGHMQLPGGSTFPQLPGGFQQLPVSFPQLPPQQQQTLPFGVATAGPWMTPVTLTPISQPPHPMAASAPPLESAGRSRALGGGGDDLLLAAKPGGGGGGEGWEPAARRPPRPSGEGGGGGRPVGPRGPRSGLLAGASRRHARLPVQQAVHRQARPLATRRLPPSFPRGVLQPEEEEEEEGGVEVEGGERGGGIVSGRRHRRHRRQASSVSAGPTRTICEGEAAVPAIYEEGEENGRKGCRNLRVSWFVWVQRSL